MDRFLIGLETDYEASGSICGLQMFSDLQGLGSTSQTVDQFRGKMPFKLDEEWCFTWNWISRVMYVCNRKLWIRAFEFWFEELIVGSRNWVSRSSVSYELIKSRFLSALLCRTLRCTEVRGMLIRSCTGAEGILVWSCTMKYGGYCLHSATRHARSIVGLGGPCWKGILAAGTGISG